MEKTLSNVSIWLYLVIAAVAETVVYYQDPGDYATEAAIGLVASVSAVVTMLFSMGMKDEPKAVQYILVVPVLLVAVLVTTMLLAYPVVF